MAQTDQTGTQGDGPDPRRAEPELWRHIGPQTARRGDRNGHAAEGPRRSVGGGTLAAAALLTVAGLATFAVMTGRRTTREGGEAAESHTDLEVERSMPVASEAADDLVRRFRDGETLAAVARRFAAVEARGGDRTVWTGPAALGTWTMRCTETNGVTRWEAEEESAPLQELSLSVRPARAGRGQVATIGVRGNPPGGFLGRAAAHALGDLLPASFATGVLYALTALVETGEIPTLDNQPTGRKQKS